MSNPLYALADAAKGLAQTGPTSQSALSDPTMSPLLTGITAVGTVMLAIWTIRRIAVPAKLDLATRTSPRPSTLTPLHVIIPLVLWVLASAVAGHFWGEMPEILLANIVGQLALLGSTLAVAHLAFRNGLVRGFGLSTRHWLFDAGRAAMGTLIAMPIVLVTLSVSRWLIPPDLQRHHVLLEQLPSLPIGWKVVLIVSAVVLAPLAEETFFRGLLQTMIRRYTRRPWVAIACASVLFGAVHASFIQDVPSLVLLAVVLGYNYERTSRLVAPILIHASFNAIMIAETLLKP